MTWWQNDPVAPSMDAAKATAGWWQNDPPADLQWSDVPGQALRNARGSAARLVSNIAQPILHPIDTAKNLGNIAYGVGSKIGGALGVEQDPQRKAANEAPADAVGAFFKDRYGSAEGLKKTLATDPVGALADAATVLTGGGALVARAPGVAGQVGRVAGRVGSAIDPIANTVRLASGTAGKVGQAAASVVGMTTGAGKMPLEYAYKAGKQSNPAFIDHMRGSAPLTDVGDMAKSAVGDMAKERSAAYTAGMKNVNGTGLINFDPIKYAVNDAFDMVHFKGEAKNAAAADAVKAVGDLVRRWEQIPTSQYRSAEGLDALKQAIYEVVQETKYGTMARKATEKVYNRVKDQIVQQVPEYAKVMKDYSNASEQISDISRTFSMGEKASKDTALRKLTSVMRNNVNTNFGQRAKLMDEMAVKQPDLPYAIAGQALNSPTPRGLQALMASGAGIYGYTNPSTLAALPLASPRLMGEAAYGAGALSGQFENALARLGVTPRQFTNALMMSNQAGQVGNALSGGIGPRYDENANLR